VNKKMILMTAVAGLLSFAGAFAFGWLTGGEAQMAAAPDQTGTERYQAAGQGQVVEIPGQGSSGSAREMVTEKRLKQLVYEVREKIGEYEGKLKALVVREERLTAVEQRLKEDVKQIEQLRVALSSTVSRLKAERENLVQSRISIGQEEESNLQAIAATYDKMDSASASKIMIEMARTGVEGGVDSGVDDVVKILHYMTERTGAKLLAELSDSEPRLAAMLCGKLKKIAEREQ